MALTMTILLIIPAIVLAYLMLMFVVSQLVIPNLGFKAKISDELPLEVKREVAKIARNSRTRRMLLEKILEFQLSNFYSEMHQVWNQFSLLFEDSFQKLWDKKGFLHCHQQAYVLRRLLLETKRFSEDDLAYRITFCYGNIHEYLLVNIGDSENKEWIKVDAYAMSLGFRLGEVLPHLAYPVIARRGLKIHGKVGYKLL